MEPLLPSTRACRPGNASRYLQQLCKHWSHKFTVAFDPTHGVIHLPGTDCVLDAEPDALRLELRASDPDVLPRMSGVVADPSQALRVPRGTDGRVVSHRPAVIS